MATARHLLLVMTRQTTCPRENTCPLGNSTGFGLVARYAFRVLNKLGGRCATFKNALRHPLPSTRSLHISGRLFLGHGAVTSLSHVVPSAHGPRVD
jgi:hypothetical protein